MRELRDEEVAEITDFSDRYVRNLRRYKTNLQLPARRVKIGTPLSASATSAMLLGAGELGKEVAIELQRLGVETGSGGSLRQCPGHAGGTPGACDRHARRPRTAARVIEAEQPDLVIPEIEAVATAELVALEQAGQRVVPTARAAALTMNREGIRRLAAETLGVATSPYRFAASEAEFHAALDAVGVPLRGEAGDEFVRQGPVHGAYAARRGSRVAHRSRRCARRRGHGDRGRFGGVRLRDYAADRAPRRRRGVLRPIGHRQQGGDYRESWQPQPMPPRHWRSASALPLSLPANSAAPASSEWSFFVQGEKVLFSEVSPRPHDTGMVTLVSQDLSEFALHVRAILNLPIPTIRQFGPSASAVILAHGDSDRVAYKLDAALAEPDVHIRLFGKPGVQGERRMGVALARAASVEAARRMARRAAASVELRY